MRIGGMLAALAAAFVLGCSHATLGSDPATSIAVADAQSGSPDEAAVLRARSLLPQVAASFSVSEGEIATAMLKAKRDMNAFGVDESLVRLLAMVNTAGIGGLPGDFEHCIGAYVEIRHRGFDHESAARGFAENFRLAMQNDEARQQRAIEYLRTGKR